MPSLKLAVRIAIPAVTLLLGVTLYAESRSNDCAHPSMYARAMQFAGMGQIQPCKIDPVTQLLCGEEGHHCNVGNGPGKCKNLENDNGQFVCVCLGK